MPKSTFPVPGDCVDVAGMDTVDINVADVAGRAVVVVGRTGDAAVAEAICDGKVERNINVVDIYAKRMSNNYGITSFHLEKWIHLWK